MDTVKLSTDIVSEDTFSKLQNELQSWKMENRILVSRIQEFEQINNLRSEIREARDKNEQLRAQYEHEQLMYRSD